MLDVRSFFKAKDRIANHYMLVILFDLAQYADRPLRAIESASSMRSAIYSETPLNLTMNPHIGAKFRFMAGK
jgi:hypothetical protein